MRALPALALLILSGCVAPSDDGADQRATAPADIPDPLAPGNRTFTQHEYDFGYLIGEDPELFPYRYPVPVHGALWLHNGTDAVPLVMLMHGRHGTCAVLGIEGIGTGTCPNAVVVTPVTSYLGYNGLAENLASHGYAVASIDANTINDRDLLGDAGANARGQLIHRTLDHFESVNATGRSLPDAAGAPTALPRREVPAAQGRLDLGRVGLMGHSRGGEGVARAVGLDATEGHGIDAAFALAPTDFARWPVPGVAFATLLPYCDGDVFNLQGAWMYDDARRLDPAAPRHQVLAMGANHNFYNTVWTGDDWGTQGEWCGSAADGSGRDSAEEQRAHGDGLMASFFRLYVGGETAFEPLWDGAGSTFPASMCPGRPSCAGRLYASKMPLARLDLAPDGMPDAHADGLAPEACAPASCPNAPTYAGAQQAAWDCAGGSSATFSAPAGWQSLSLRVGGTSDAIRLWLEAGGTVSPDAVLPARPGGEDNAKTVLSEVRFALGGVGGDLVVHCSGNGKLQVADVMLV